MKILIVHNQYIYRGGEDQVVQSEISMLKEMGHQVYLYEQSNHQLEKMNLFEKVSFVCNEMVFSKRVYKEVRQLIEECKPDLVHVHNIFYIITPAVYQACKDENIPVIQTLHNFRWVCPAATLFRDGHCCHECLDHGFNRSIIHQCFKDSYWQTWMLVKVLKSLKNHVNSIRSIIVLSEFTKNILVKQGFEEKTMVVKPNFFDDSGPNPSNKDNYVVYVGALQPYKGVDIVIKAWKDFNIITPLKIFGDGPQLQQLKSMAIGLPIEFKGQQELSCVLNELARAQCVIVPSLCYENFPRIIVEAFAMATPVIASKLGAMAEIVNDGVTGLLFSPGDSADLYNKLKLLLENDVLLSNLSINARQEYKNKYTKAMNYQKLMEIYEQAIK